jgi:hypothetical protein
MCSTQQGLVDHISRRTAFLMSNCMWSTIWHYIPAGGETSSRLRARKQLTINSRAIHDQLISTTKEPQLVPPAQVSTELRRRNVQELWIQFSHGRCLCEQVDYLSFAIMEVQSNALYSFETCVESSLRMLKACGICDYCHYGHSLSHIQRRCTLK